MYLNPVAGAGKGRAIFEEVEPLLRDAGVDCTTVLLTARGQPTAALAAMPWAELRGYEGVAAVGGDGSLSEVVEGLMAREDWYAASRAVTLGIIPSGSGNGLAVSLCAEAGLPYCAQSAALLIAKGGASRMDVASAFVAREAGHGQRPPLWGGGSGAGALPSGGLASAASFYTCASGSPEGDVEGGGGGGFAVAAGSPKGSERGAAGGFPRSQGSAKECIR